MGSRLQEGDTFPSRGMGLFSGSRGMQRPSKGMSTKYISYIETPQLNCYSIHIFFAASLNGCTDSKAKAFLAKHSIVYVINIHIIATYNAWLLPHFSTRSDALLAPAMTCYAYIKG